MHSVVWLDLQRLVRASRIAAKTQLADPHMHHLMLIIVHHLPVPSLPLICNRPFEMRLAAFFAHQALGKIDSACNWPSMLSVSCIWRRKLSGPLQCEETFTLRVQVVDIRRTARLRFVGSYAQHWSAYWVPDGMKHSHGHLRVCQKE